MNDDFNQTAWTLEGQFGDLDVVYTGAFLDRDVTANIDYTGYTNIGAFISGYQCEYLVGGFYTGLTETTNTYNWDPTISGNTGVVECGTPANAARIENENTRWTHEFRFATNWDGRLNMQGGVFFEDFEILHRKANVFFSVLALASSLVTSLLCPSFTMVGHHLFWVTIRLLATKLPNDSHEGEPCGS